MSGFFGDLSKAAGAVSSVSGVVGQVSGLATSLGDLASGNFTAALSKLGPWASGLRQASWRGKTFAVHESRIRKGRRVSVHVYPFRDDVWVEDLGRGVRKFGFRAFLIGDDVLQQSAAMQQAVEQPGPGTLIHPSLGSLNCSVIEFSARESAERGRVVELEFEFIETAKPLYPSLVQSTQAGVKAAASGTWAALASDFQNDVVKPLQEGAQVVEKATQTVAKWTGVATHLAGDASMMVRSVSGLVGNFGRYSSAGMTLLQSSSATVSSLLSGVTTARTAVSEAADAAQSLSSLL